MKQHLATLPFSGFYETIHGSKIDDDIEYYLSELSDEYIENNFTNGDIWHDIEIDFTRFKNDYSRAYVNHFASEYDINDMTFESVESPRYYNYSTDRIFVNLTSEAVLNIIRCTDKDILKTVIKERFTSYDGFNSFYSNDVFEWGSIIENWDHNQLGALLEAFVYTETQLNPESDYMPEFYDVEIDGMEYVDDKTADKLMKGIE